MDETKINKCIAETELLYYDVFIDYLGTLVNSPIFGACVVFPCAKSRELVDSNFRADSPMQLTINVSKCIEHNRPISGEEASVKASNHQTKTVKTTFLHGTSS